MEELTPTEAEKREVSRRSSPIGRSFKGKHVVGKTSASQQAALDTVAKTIVRVEAPGEEEDPESAPGIIVITPLSDEARQQLQMQLDEDAYARELKTVGIAGQICSNIEIPDLATLSLHLRSSVHEANGKSIFLSMYNPRCAIGIFSTRGNIVSLGTSNIQDMQLSLKKMCLVLQLLGYTGVAYSPPLVMNVVQTFNFGYRLNLEGLSSDPRLTPDLTVDEKQTIFPGITMDDTKNGVVCNVFESGKLVFTLKRVRTRRPSLKYRREIATGGYGFSYEGVLQRIAASWTEIKPILSDPKYKRG